MRYLALILSLLLSLFGGSKREDVRLESALEPAIEVRNQDSDAARDQAFNRDLCLTAATSSSFAGGEHSGPVSVRSTNSSHRTNPSTKSTTRMLKAGKSLCVRHFKPFLCAVSLAESGSLTAERYLFAICRLRL